MVESAQGLEPDRLCLLPAVRAQIQSFGCLDVFAPLALIPSLSCHSDNSNMHRKHTALCPDVARL